MIRADLPVARQRVLESAYMSSYRVPGLFVAVCLIAGMPGLLSQTRATTLDIYFIDTEGGQSTLYVAPSGESLLVDTGNPGDRDLSRIVDTLKTAGVRQIDHLWITHYHSDHVGSLLALRLLENNRRRLFFQELVIRRQSEQLEEETAKSEQLILNILPASIARRLREGEQPIADDYPHVSVLFADIVGFTPMSASLSAQDLIQLLSRLFSSFVALVAVATPIAGRDVARCRGRRLSESRIGPGGRDFTPLLA